MGSRKFDIFIGIDQTGAVGPSGKPKALDVSIIYSKNKIHFETGLKIKSFSRQALTEVIQERVPIRESTRVLICVDALFSLPLALRISHAELLRQAKDYSFKSKPYGAQTAFQFFNQFQGTEPVLHRRIDLRVGAQSVFHLHPFQRNIGCGSYRILKDLAQETKWASLWPLEAIDHQLVIAEGYPSHYWSTILDCSQRDLSVAKARYKKLNFADMNQADSFLLALAAQRYHGQIFETVKDPEIKAEGWILGVPFKEAQAQLPLTERRRKYSRPQTRHRPK